MRKIILTAAVAVLVLFTTGFIAADDWFLLDTPAFMIQFPKKPDTQQSEQNTKVGKVQISSSMYDGSVDNDDNFLYGVSSASYPDSTIDSGKKALLEGFFRGAVDGAVTNVGGKLLTEKAIEINGFPGREVTIDFKNGLAIILMRTYLVHNTTYILQTITPPGKANNASVKKFHDSFKLK